LVTLRTLEVEEELRALEVLEVLQELQALRDQQLPELLGSQAAEAV
jgi:hypothetical protein